MKLLTIYFVGATIPMLVKEECVDQCRKELQELLRARFSVDRKSVAVKIGEDVEFSTRYLIGYRIAEYKPDSQTEMVSLVREAVRLYDQELNEGDDWKQ